MTFFAIILYIIGVIFFGYLAYISYAGVRIFWEEKNYGGIIMMLLMAVSLTIMLIYLLYTGVKGMLDNDLSTVLYIIGGVCIFLIGFFVIKRNKYRLNMNKDTLKTIGWWVAAITIIALCVWGVRSCECHEDVKREAKRVQKENEKLQEILSDKYLYMDRNGVYHIDHDCRMLTRHHYDSEDNRIYDSYSSSYVSRDSIKNWYNFAATHQLCSKCFSPAIIRQLDSIRLEYNIDEDEEYYNIHSSKERIVAPWVKQ